MHAITASRLFFSLTPLHPEPMRSEGAAELKNRSSGKRVRSATSISIGLVIGFALCTATENQAAVITMQQAAVIAMQQATATYSQDWQGWPVNEAIDGVFDPGNGWAIYEGRFGEPNTDNLTHAQTAVFETVSDASFPALEFTLHQLLEWGAGNGLHTLGHFRFSATTDARSEFADGLTSGGDVTANWTVLHPITASATGGASLNILGDGSILVGGTSPITAVYTVTAPAFSGITGIRLEVMADNSLPNSGPGRAPNGNFALTEFQVTGVPEPGTTSLLLLGVASLLAPWSRRRRQS